MPREFRMITDLATVAPKELLFNYEELKAYLSEELQAYKTMIVTSDAITDAKSTRAYLNKLAASLDEYRKTVKKILLEQYENDFAPKVNELRTMTKEAVDHIDVQIKAFERQEKDMRVASLRSYFDSSVHGLEDYISWERIYNPKWETKSYGMANAEMDIDSEIETTEANVEAIKAMHSPFETALLLVLAETGDMGKVMQKKAACEAIEARKEERAQERDRNAVESIGASDHAETQPPPAKREIGAKTYTFTLTFEATKEQAFLINDFFKSNHIKFRKVENP